MCEIKQPIILTLVTFFINYLATYIGSKFPMKVLFVTLTVRGGTIEIYSNR